MNLEIRDVLFPVDYKSAEKDIGVDGRGYISFKSLVEWLANVLLIWLSGRARRWSSAIQQSGQAKRLLIVDQGVIRRSDKRGSDWLMMKRSKADFMCHRAVVPLFGETIEAP